MTNLRPDSLQPIAEGGLGHPGSALAHAMTWFRGRLYVGTSAQHPQGSGDKARILCFNPETGTWRTAWESPAKWLDEDMRPRAKGLVPAGAGEKMRDRAGQDKMGRDFGIRAMTLFQGRSDPHPCLYAATMSIWGGLLLRSEDGFRFAPVTQPGMGNDTVLSFRGLCGFDGKLYLAPAGTVTDETLDRDAAPGGLLYASDDPASGIWTPVNEPAFGDPRNAGVHALATAHGYLYAATHNPLRGFQLWRTDGKAAEGALPAWTRVLTDGAYRYTPNAKAVALCEFRGDLYVATGLPGFGYDSRNKIGPAAFELLRVHRDASWDLIAGEVRFTPDGLRVPLSAMGEGFSNRYNAAVWSLAVHKDRLYLGTHNWEPNAWIMADRTEEMRGGYQLWASSNGEDWDLVLDQGNGKRSAVGVRSICSTPAGLFMGTTNQARLLAHQAYAKSRLRLPKETEGFAVFQAPD